MKKGTLVALWVVYFLCLAPALVTLTHRIQLDSGFNSVALVTDYFKLLQLAQTENVPVDDLLARVRDEAGIERIALVEDTPLFLAQKGICTIVEGVGWPDWTSPEEREEIERNEGREPSEPEAPSADWPMLYGLSHDKTHLIFNDQENFLRIAAAALLRYGSMVEVTDNIGPGGIVSLAGDPRVTLEWGLGFDFRLATHLDELGFTIYPRLRDYPGFSEAMVSSILLETVGHFPDGLIIFDGDNVLGGTGPVQTTASRMIDRNLNYGWVEFAEQVGGASLAWLLPNHTARVHSVEDEIQEVYSVDSLITRYVRSARERSVRVIYLKPFLMAIDNSDRIEKSLTLFSGVKSELESTGFVIGEPSRLTGPVTASLFTKIAAALALGIGLTLLLQLVKLRMNIIWLVLFLIGSFAVLFVMGVKYVALGISIVSPTLAVAWIVGRYDGAWAEIRKLRVTSLWPAVGLWLGAVAITLTGAVLIASSMIDERTLLGIDAFSGVKLALYLPVLLSMLIGVQLIVPGDKQTLLGGLTWLLEFPLKIWHVILGLIGLIAIFVLLDRSGNFPIIPVGDWENQFRGWFETLLYARPRTKEMLIGHPALLIGLYLGLSMINIRRALAFGGVVIGSIALTSMTNTFCHIHTPLVLTLYRTFAGAIIGLIVGLIIGAIVLGLVRHGRPHVT